ncbi:MAG: YhbY family RNA-binding protein [Methylophilaceae bacterium]|nr:YhbY family RNA-binding protein [Methylophilaceae bacterium]
MPALSSRQVRFLRSASHGLSPVVMIGHNGLTQAVLNEINRNLDAHELIKIKVMGDSRTARVNMLYDICEKLDAAPIHHIGRQLVIYRPAKKPKIVLPQN